MTKHNIVKYKINCVIRVCKEGRKRKFAEEVETLQLDLIDKKSESLLKHFDDVADKIHEIEESKKKCLIHCVGGNSRSPSLVIGEPPFHFDILFKTYPSFISNLIVS